MIVAKRRKMFHLFYPLVGIGALLWFLIRVIPKPSRAAYPCMRVAAPLASSFFLWLIGVFSSWLFLRHAALFFRQSRYVIAAACIVSGGIVGSIFLSSPQSRPFAMAALSEPRIPNNPVGTARGANPGRVVWVHDSNATSWGGVGHGHLWESGNTNQTVVDRMMSQSLRSLAGQDSDATAWDTLFRYFNSNHGRGNKGYSAGEKIAIKTNFVFCIYTPAFTSVDTNTYSLFRLLDYMNTSPIIVRALLRQLVYVVGVNQSDISVGDPVTYYPNEYYDSCHAEFPDVHYIDHLGKFGRTRAQLSTIPLYFSCRPPVEKQDYIPSHYAEATYLINCANMKSHAANGITAGAKNHFGSFNRIPDDSGYYNLHESLPAFTPQTGKYRVLVDLMGNEHLGGKTVLYLVDGLYAGNHNLDTVPHKWPATPFNGDWTSSLFASQDPVAIESVLFDIFQLDDDPSQYPKMAGAEDYLLEAATADNPPSGTFYDPNHATATTRLPSLGVYEHWNNSVDKKYSRNLGTGNGIDLVFMDNVTSSVHGQENNRERHQAISWQRTGTRGEFLLHVPCACNLRIDLFNSLGRKLGSRIETNRAAGNYTLRLHSISGCAAPLPPGMYVCALYDQANNNHTAIARLRTTISGRD